MVTFGLDQPFPQPSPSPVSPTQSKRPIRRRRSLAAPQVTQAALQAPLHRAANRAAVVEATPVARHALKPVRR